MAAYLYIDGENLRHYIKDVLKLNNIKNPEIVNVDIPKLFTKVLKDIKVKQKTYYSAKLEYQPDQPGKSKKIIESQRNLKSVLENHGFTFLISGRVRRFNVRVAGKSIPIFKEKGVDVKIAVDMVSHSCDKLVKTVILCSSDSDLQPAIREVKNRKIQVIYLGFELNPNKGIIYTSDRTILIRDAEILDCVIDKKTL